MNRNQSVAWTLTREEAEHLARRFNFRGGAQYTVVASQAPLPAWGGTSTLERANLTDALLP